MRRESRSDHLSESFTDLMTSLMVIFILLLLVFVNNQASANSVTAQSLMSELRTQLEPAGFKREDIRIDPNDPSTILLAVSDAQLTFQPNSFQLQPGGEQFVESRMPKLTETVCAAKYRGVVESVIVEGHSDSAPWRGATEEESQARNLKLSQERSMEVVEKTLAALSSQPGLRSCLLEKIAATGRGEQDLAATADTSRRALIKVRINATHAAEFAKAIAAEKAAPPAPPIVTPASAKVLDLISRLNTQPRQPVSFRLTEQEVNGYLRYALLATPRPGIDSLSMKFFPHNYISVWIVIDFDAVDRWSPGLVPGLFGLTGKKAIWIDIRFSAGDGTLTYAIEKAYYQDKALPHYLAEKIIQTIGARQPENASGLQIVTPFGLRHIQTGEHYIEGEN